jgi:hypothetical protein
MPSVWSVGAHSRHRSSARCLTMSWTRTLALCRARQLGGLGDSANGRRRTPMAAPVHPASNRNPCDRRRRCTGARPGGCQWVRLLESAGAPGCARGRRHRQRGTGCARPPRANARMSRGWRTLSDHHRRRRETQLFPIFREVRRSSSEGGSRNRSETGSRWGGGGRGASAAAGIAHQSGRGPG